MRGWLKLGLAMALLFGAAPAMAQALGPNSSDGENFLKAIEDGDNSAALPLIDKPGAQVANYRGYNGNTALHIATKKRALDWVGYLLRKGADPNVGDAQGDTALMIASRIGFDDAAQWMVENGARVDATNRRGETALIIAIQQRQPRMVELLLKAGANPDKADHAAGLTARAALRTSALASLRGFI